MKKICKILIACIVFFGITTALYATTNILPKEKLEIKKVAILGAGVFLVVQILFVSYQTDKLEEKNIKMLQVAEIKTAENIKNTQNKIESIKKEYEEILEVSKTKEDIIKENEEKDKTKYLEDNFYLLEKNENAQEEKDLFLKVNINKKIEELPINVTFENMKEKNINNRNDKNNKKNIKIINNLEEANRRNDIKIVRERKKRNLNEKTIVNKMLKEKIEEGKIVERSLIKEIYDSRKRAKKIAKEIKKNKKIQDKK